MGRSHSEAGWWLEPQNGRWHARWRRDLEEGESKRAVPKKSTKIMVGEGKREQKRNRTLAEAKAKEYMEADLAEQRGEVDPYARHAAKRLHEHLDEFIKSKQADDLNTNYVKHLRMRLERAFAYMGAKFIRDLDPDQAN